MEDRIESLISNAKMFVLHKTSGESDIFDMKFAGIASDETPDLSPQQESILRKNLDLTYASQRGFVNWDHSRAPEDQIGYLTKAVVIPPKQVETYAALLGTELSKSASVYVEGVLYKSVDRAKKVFEIMRSVEPGQQVGLGLSLDGSAVRDAETGSLKKAIVRGVAITPSPAHTRTFCSLRKSLCANVPEIPIKELGDKNLQKSSDGLTLDEAILAVMKMRPHLSYNLAKRVVDLTIRKKQKGLI